MKFQLLPAVALSAVLFAACSDVDLPTTPTEPGATSISAVVEGRQVVISWTLPADMSGVEAVELYRDAQLLATLPVDATTYTIGRESSGREIVYTVKLRYTNGLVSEGLSTVNLIEAAPAKPAMLIAEESIDALTDDDELAAAKWFVKTYPEGVLLTPSQLTGLDPDNFNVIWINIDRVGLAQGWRKLPKSISGTAPMAALKEYVQLGGNVFLTKHAVQLCVPLGYQDALYAPGIFSSGEGGEGSDNWATNANIGLTYDHRNHPIFAGLTTIADYGHETFALEGPGWREDHNTMWDLNSYGLTGGANTVEAFEAACHCTVLATWAHVTDFAVAGIVEFKPTEACPSKALTIGLSAYEFNQNTGNPFQENTERLTKNCIDYLLR